ncbi:MAG: hypothetical protein IT306_18075 [Chloroflexi bacterium]|nr:hypothetical protein [Chloroflexota bacterium]
MVDEAIGRRLLEEAGAAVGPVYGRRGRAPLLTSLDGYNRAAAFDPWLVIVDLDQDGPCPGDVRTCWLPAPSEHMCFRIAVCEAEAWLLADRESVADFLGISVRIVPVHPEQLPDPKRSLIDLARRSRRRTVREDLVPSPGSGRSVGPGYTGRMIEFVNTSWRPAAAAQEAPSLLRCQMRLQTMVDSLDRP